MCSAIEPSNDLKVRDKHAMQTSDGTIQAQKPFFGSILITILVGKAGRTLPHFLIGSLLQEGQA